MNPMDLSGRVAVVTGAGRGQGAVEAEVLARAGAAVWLADVLEAEGEAKEKSLRNEGLDVRFFKLDVTSEAAWDALVTAAKNVDVLVNNAGIISRKIIGQMEPEAWRKVLEVNLTGAFLGIRRVAPMMAAAGGGSIVNIASNSAFSGHYDAAYTASKWGLRGLTRSAAMEFARQGVRVNSVCPGLIETELNRGSPHLKPMIDITPMGRSGSAEEVARLVHFLASDASGFITGEDFVIDGGFTAGAAYRRVAQETGLL